MTFSKVSVLVPTRRRVARLHELLKSWHDTVTDASAELIFRIDDNDGESRTYLSEHDHRVLVGPRLDGYRSLPAFFEEMRAVATGDLLMTGNDDMVFRTPGWSKVLCDEANKYPDGVFCFGVNVQNEKNFPFAVVSASAINRIGYLHHPQIFWGDVYLRDVFAAFGRSIALPSVRVDHQWAGHRPDQTFEESGQRDSQWWNEAYWAHHHLCVAESVRLLREQMAVAS